MLDGRGIVLVVDDDDDWVDSLSDFLREEGFSVVEAPNGLVALDALSHTQPFAVVTDLQMPVMDGRQLLAGVHAQDARVPVIVVTAATVQDHDASLAEAFQVIRKPVPVEDLLSALEAAKAHRAASLPLQRLSRASVVPPPRDEDVGRFFARPVVVLTIALAASLALFIHWRCKVI